MFTEKEKAYIEAQALARLGTVDAEGQVDVSPVAFTFDGKSFYIGGHAKTRKYRNVGGGQAKVALAIDHRDGPGVFAGIKVFGNASIEDYQSQRSNEITPHLKITPTVHWSWGIEDEALRDGEFVHNKIEW